MACIHPEYGKSADLIKHAEIEGCQSIVWDIQIFQFRQILKRLKRNIEYLIPFQIEAFDVFQVHKRSPVQSLKSVVIQMKFFEFWEINKRMLTNRSNVIEWQVDFLKIWVYIALKKNYSISVEN